MIQLTNLDIDIELQMTLPIYSMNRAELWLEGTLE